MRVFNYMITDEVGIHARPAGNLVKEAKKFVSKVTINAGGKSVDATKLMAIMGMGIKQGDEVSVAVEGDDEDNAVEQLEKFFRENL